jgi:hypothetical protein
MEKISIILLDFSINTDCDKKIGIWLYYSLLERGRI